MIQCVLGMKRYILGPVLFLLIAAAFFVGKERVLGVSTGAPPYGEPEGEVPTGPLAWLRDWSRPDVPPTAGIQVGHYKNEEFPEELAKLRGNSGAAAAGVAEWEVNLAIAEQMKVILEKEGVVVDIIPATVPPGYWADAFVAVHADGSLDGSKSGYKFAGPWRDLTGDSDRLVELLSQEYEKATDLKFDPNITRNMRGYYAFSFWRYRHAVHPMTTAVIAETGFLTNASDRRLLTSSPEIPARAMTNAILQYLEEEGLLPS